MNLLNYRKSQSRPPPGAVPPLFLPETFNFRLVVAVPLQFQKHIFNLYM